MFGKYSYLYLSLKLNFTLYTSFCVVDLFGGRLHYSDHRKHGHFVLHSATYQSKTIFTVLLACYNELSWEILLEARLVA
jgi:hypothetical protein